MALRGIDPSRQNRWFRRLAVGPVGSTASQAPFHIKPTAEPTAVTGAAGDIYFDSTLNTLVPHNGVDFVAGGAKRRVLASSGNTTMTSAMNGSVMLIDGASTDYTLPAIGAGDIGMWFDFVCTIVSTGTQTITAGAADLLMGYANVVDTAADIDVFVPDESDDLIITINGTTTGGKIVGSALSLIAITATRWNVQANLLTATETQATPFS